MWEILRLRRIVPFLHGTKPPEPEYTPPSREEIDRVMAPTDEHRRKAERKRREMIQRLDAARRARLEGRQGSPQTLERLSGPREDTSRAPRRRP